MPVPEGKDEAMAPFRSTKALKLSCVVARLFLFLPPNRGQKKKWSKRPMRNVEPQGKDKAMTPFRGTKASKLSCVVAQAFSGITVKV